MYTITLLYSLSWCMEHFCFNLHREPYFLFLSALHRSINRQRLVAHSTAMESIQAESEPIDEEEDVP